MGLAVVALFLAVALGAPLGAGALLRRDPEARRPLTRRVLVTGVGCSLAVVLAKLVILIPASEQWLATFLAPCPLPLLELWVSAERDLALPAAAVFFAAVAPFVPKERDRRVLGRMPWLLVLYLGATNAWRLGTPGCYEQDYLVVDGVSLQSTDYTCGAASAATVLRAHQVADATEHECARLSHTIPGKGVTDLGAVLALRRKLPVGAVVAVRAASLEDLPRVPLPCLAPLRYSFWFDHMVVVLEADATGVLLGDPLRGRVRETHAALAPRWRGTVIAVARD